MIDPTDSSRSRRGQFSPSAHSCASRRVGNTNGGFSNATPSHTSNPFFCRSIRYLFIVCLVACWLVATEPYCCFHFSQTCWIRIRIHSRCPTLPGEEWSLPFLTGLRRPSAEGRWADFHQPILPSLPHTAPSSSATKPGAPAAARAEARVFHVGPEYPGQSTFSQDSNHAQANPASPLSDSLHPPP